eukprot:1303010-Rhodomonas_salina.2
MALLSQVLSAHVISAEPVRSGSEHEGPSSTHAPAGEAAGPNNGLQGMRKHVIATITRHQAFEEEDMLDLVLQPATITCPGGGGARGHGGGRGGGGRATAGGPGYARALCTGLLPSVRVPAPHRTRQPGRVVLECADSFPPGEGTN